MGEFEQHGVVHMDIGTMWSGKTTRLLAHLREHVAYPLKTLHVILIKFDIDTRETGVRAEVKSHRGELVSNDDFPNLEVVILARNGGLDAFNPEAVPDAIFIDEAHFATRDHEPATVLLDFVTRWRAKTKIYISALDSWALERRQSRVGCETKGYTVNPIVSVCMLTAFVPSVYKTPGYCMGCGRPLAVFNERLDADYEVRASNDRIQVGGADKYRIVCYECAY